MLLVGEGLKESVFRTACVLLSYQPFLIIVCLALNETVRLFSCLFLVCLAVSLTF